MTLASARNCVALALTPVTLRALIPDRTTFPVAAIGSGDRKLMNCAYRTY